MSERWGKIEGGKDAKVVPAHMAEVGKQPLHLPT